MQNLRKRIAEKFYTNIFILNPFGIYVLGDAIVLIPFIFIFFPTVYFFFGLKYLVISWCIYMGLRHFIEIVYWLLQQFGDKTYRPPFIFEEFQNEDIYIIYQLMSTVWTVVYSFIGIYAIIEL
jgi:hypothetical protein